MNKPLRWHLVLTKPSMELVASRNLERQGYRVYYPRLQQRVSRRGTLCDAVRPLFPRYVFVQLNAELQTLAPMHSTLGVADVVRFGAEYATVADHIVDDLMRRADPVSGLHRLRSPRVMAAGAAVSIVHGVLSGLAGIFERSDGEGRAVVLLSLLGCDTRVKLPTYSVVPSEAA